MKSLKNFPAEAVIWIVSLLTLALLNTEDSTHITICPLAHLGFAFCPGCGLGRSISLLFHGQLARSFAAHPLGIFAVIVLSFRIFQLTQNYLKLYGKNNRRPSGAYR